MVSTLSRREYTRDACGVDSRLDSIDAVCEVALEHGSRPAGVAVVEGAVGREGSVFLSLDQGDGAFAGATASG